MILTRFTCFAGVLAASAALSWAAHGAVVSGSFSGVTDDVRAAADLTALGGLDWVIWDDPDGADGYTDPAPIYNEKAGGGAIGGLSSSLLGEPGTPPSGLVRSSFPTAHTFAYTDGTAPASEADSGTRGVTIRGQADGINDPATNFAFTVTAQSLAEHTLTLFGTLRRSGVQITSTLNAVNNVDVINPVANANEEWVYTLSFTPDAIGDQLTVVITGSGVTLAGEEGSFFNGFRVGAAAVSVVPEPGALVLLGLGALAVLPRRRRVC